MIASALWEIMSSITSKESWYSKVWDKEIQIKWFEELSNQYGNNPSLSSNFWTAIHISKQRLKALISKLIAGGVMTIFAKSVSTKYKA